MRKLRVLIIKLGGYGLAPQPLQYNPVRQRGNKNSQRGSSRRTQTS